MWIGIDDTDSRNGGCTTYVCFEFVSRLYNHGFCLLSYPRLVRLNPQVPWKTRGNGAIAVNVGTNGNKNELFGRYNTNKFHFDPSAEKHDIDKETILGLLSDVLDEYAELSEKQTNPAFVISSTPFSHDFYQKAVHNLVTIDEAKQVVDGENGSYVLLKNGRGVIGATAALSWDEYGDHTYELITYRKHHQWKTPRKVNDESVKMMDTSFPSTFNNYDYQNRYNCLVPHSPCPILYGIRGDEVNVLPSCMESIKSEDALGWMIFKTNQATDDHVRRRKIQTIKPYQSVITQGWVATKPERKKGGHVFFSLNDMNTSSIDCAAYEPTKEFRDIIQRLSIGDELEVYGGVREEPLTINIEKINILNLVDIFEKIENPVCSICKKHMKSKGKDQGYFCKRCRTTSSMPRVKKMPRGLQPGFYEVPICARRHLVKPLKRMKKR